MPRDVKYRFSYKDGSEDWVTLTDVTLSDVTEDRTYRKTVVSAEAILYDANSDGALASWDVLMCYTSAAVELEVTCKENDANEEIFVTTLRPNLPFLLGTDDSRYNHGADDGFAGTADVIDKIRVKESNAVSAEVVLKLWKV